MLNISFQRQHLSNGYKTFELDPLGQLDHVCMQQYAYSTLNYRMYFYAAGSCTVLSLVVLYVWMSVYVEHEPRQIPITR